MDGLVTTFSVVAGVAGVIKYYISGWIAYRSSAGDGYSQFNW